MICGALEYLQPWIIDQCLDLSCALGQLRNCNCATDLLWAVGAMRNLEDAARAGLHALGRGASAASADPDAPENPADEIARTKALAKAFGHI